MMKYKRGNIISSNINTPAIISSFSPTSLSILRSWSKMGLNSAVIWLIRNDEKGPQLNYVSHAMGLDRHLFQQKEGLLIIADFLNRISADGLCCIGDNIALRLLENQELFPDRLHLWIPPVQTLTSILSKTNQINTALKVGMSVLPNYELCSGSRDSLIPDMKHFPLCLRPSSPGAVIPSFKAEIVYSPDELNCFLDSHKTQNGTIIAQPFCQLPNLVVHGARTKDGQSIGIQGFIVERKFEGVTLTIRSMDIPDRLKLLCEKFVDDFNLVGHYHFEFLFDPANEKYYFLEINARFGGTTAKVCACGYDEPFYALRAQGVGCESLDDNINKKTVSSKLALIKYLLQILQNKITPLDYPMESKAKGVWNTIKGIVGYKDDIINIKDIFGAMQLYLSVIRSKFK